MGASALIPAYGCQCWSRRCSRLLRMVAPYSPRGYRTASTSWSHSRTKQAIAPSHIPEKQCNDHEGDNYSTMKIQSTYDVQMSDFMV